MTSIAFPQIALFTVLVITIIFMLSKNILLSAVIGVAVLLLGSNGYLETIGIGEMAAANRCREYLEKNGGCGFLSLNN